MVQRQNLAYKFIEVLGVCKYGFFSLQYCFQFYSYKPEAGETMDAYPFILVLCITCIQSEIFSLKNEEISEDKNMRNKH